MPRVAESFALGRVERVEQALPARGIDARASVADRYRGMTIGYL